MSKKARVKVWFSSQELGSRGYFIPGGASQRGGWSGSGVPCRMLSALDYPELRSVTYDVPARSILATVK